MDDKKPGKLKRRSVSAARLYWAIMDACERYELDKGEAWEATVNVFTLLEALKDDIVEAAR